MSVLRNARQVHGRSQDVCTPRYLFNPIARFLAPRNRGGTAAIPGLDIDVLDDEQLFVDLDPCWNRDSPVRAHVRWAKKDDGLGREWAQAFSFLHETELVHAGPPGTIFCNPPWEDLEPWLWRCAAARDYAEVVALVPLRPHRNNFAAAFSADAWCLLRPVVFEGETNAFPMACVLLYWGPRAEAFCRFFSGPERWQGMVLTREAWGRNVSRTMKRYPSYRSNGPKKKTAAEPKKLHPAVHALRRILRYAFRSYFYDDEHVEYDPQRQADEDFLEEPIPALIEAFPPGNLTDWTRVDDVLRAIVAVTEDEEIAKALEGVFTNRRTLKELEPEYWQHLAKKSKADEAAKKKKAASTTAKKAVKTRKAKAKTGKKRATPIKDLRERSKRLAAKRSTHATKPAKKAPPRPARAAKPKAAKTAAKPKGKKAESLAVLARRLHVGEAVPDRDVERLIKAGLAGRTWRGQTLISQSLTHRGFKLIGVHRKPDAEAGVDERQRTLDEVTDALAGDDEGTDAFREPGASTSEPGPAAAAARSPKNGSPKNGHRRGAVSGPAHGVLATPDDAVRARLGATGSIVNLEEIGKAIGKSKATVIRSLHRLREEKLVKLEGGGRGAKWVVQ